MCVSTAVSYTHLDVYKRQVPLMFAFGAFSSLLSLKFTKQMMKVTSVLVIILGVVMGNRGLLLSGINVSEAILSPLGISLANDNKNANAVIKDGYQILTTNLEPGRYQPINVYAGCLLYTSNLTDFL